MKLVSWNINGIRSAEEKFLEFMASYEPDILMIQELRADPNDLSFFLKFIPGYKAEFNPSSRPGWSGTAWYQKVGLPILNLTCATGNRVLDDEGRTIFGRLGNTCLFNFYTPNGTSGDERLNYKLKFYEETKRYLSDLLGAGRSVIVGGDLNVGHTELDLYEPERAQGHSGFLLSERKWMDDLLGMGLVDSFRMFEKGGGHYTWWHMRDPERKLNRGWRFDYFLVSKDLENRVKASKILRDVYGSDHCPILLEIDL